MLQRRLGFLCKALSLPRSRYGDRGEAVFMELQATRDPAKFGRHRGRGRG